MEEDRKKLTQNPKIHVRMVFIDIALLNLKSHVNTFELKK
jgi:hypothetical protein